MTILALDSSGPVAAVALARAAEDGPPVMTASFRLQSGLTHSETLMPMMEEMVRLSGTDLGAVDAIAVASGPGSFTGLRIGASCAKGLAFALQRPIVPVPTLDAMAYRLAGTHGLVCPMMDARRKQVYTGLYAFRAAGEDGGGEWETGYRMETLLPSCAVPVAELLPEINRRYRECFPSESDAKEQNAPVVSFLGDGVPVCKDVIRETLTVPYRFVPFHQDRQCAESVCALAFLLYRRGKAVDVSRFVPEYLRQSQAEQNEALQKIKNRE